MKKEYKQLNNIKCECGYYNHEENIKKYGTCRRCGKVLDSKAKYEYEMVCRLHLWRTKKRGEHI